MQRGACASGDLHSARAGAAILEAGGNAVDAAVAAGLMACVTLPTMTSLGGGGILTLQVDGRVTICDCFATIPGIEARRHGRRELDIVTVDFDGVLVDFQVRAPSIAVPGTVAGLWEVHLRHGKLPLAEVAAPAIHAGRRGYEVTPSQTTAFALLEEIFRMSPETWALVSNGDAVAQPGERLALPDLADSIEQLVTEGPAAFYEGDIARRIVEASEDWVTPEDLAAYEPRFREPLRGTYRGWSLHLPAMPSVTGGMVLRALAVMEDGGPVPREFDVPTWGRIADAQQQAAALRTTEYETRLFDEGWLQGLVAANAGGNTMHISTADAEGNLVAYTTTVGESAGCTAPGTGIALNNFLGEDDIMPVGGLRDPGRRMMTSMCPTILHDGRERRLALGSAGSARIKSALLQIILQTVDGRRGPQDAVSAGRIHMEKDKLYVEGWGRDPEETEAIAELREDHEVVKGCGFFFGGAQVVERGPKGFRAGADDARRGCAAVVV